MNHEMSIMRLIKTTIEDLFILEPRVFADNRGYFFEIEAAKARKPL